ncbi:MAG: Ig-like domain-containing protein [Dehalococcoidia bacterium]|nr:Ig-like domain-containing protein [Dehalococcoidia bacterium]
MLPRLVIVLVVCLIAIALPAVPAQAQCGGPFIELSPSSGAPGTEVTINGQDFDAGKYVDIYYDGTIRATGKTDSSGDFTIPFTVPEGCKGAYQVHAKVGADVGYDTADSYFTVKPGLTVTPEKGPVGTNVTVRGQGFAQNEQGIELMYYLNDNYQTIQRRIVANATGSWEMSFPIPPSTRGEHKLDAEGDESKLYEVKDATFKVTPEISIDKSSGIVGESITMTGSRFAAYEKNIQILFDGQAVVTDIKANAQGDWEGSFEVPEMPTGTYSVIAEGEWTKKEDVIGLSFKIEPDIVLPPDEGYVGMNLTVTGHGFAANEDVVIKYDGSQVKTVETNAQGSFEVSFVVLESPHGEHQVTAEDAAGNNATAFFSMESHPPDIPTLISPSNGGWAGLIGKVTPTLEWSAVFDDSGVRYRLQIATSANVTATGEFVHPIVSVVDIVGTNYTLNATDALPYGTYYWIVQAVDGAGNERGWTAAHSFRAGLLPLWGFIAAIVAIVILLGILVRFLVRRRIYYYD